MKAIRLCFFFLFFSCNSIINAQNFLIGNWYYCDESKQYIELHITKELIEWCPETEPLGVIYFYKLNEKTLTISTDFNTNEGVRNGIIEYADNDSIKITYLGLNNQREEIIMYKIPQKINTLLNLKKINDQNEYLKNYNYRRKKNKCK